MTKYKLGLFIFHRDFRLYDNTGFLAACSQCDKLITCFICTPEQLGNKNAYKSDNAICFMFESLAELSSTIHSSGGELYFFHGKSDEIVRDLVQTAHIDAVFFNRDYSPYAKMRDQSILNVCHSLRIECETSSDYYLYEPGTVKTVAGSYYKKFTPFYDAVLPIIVDTPKKTAAKHLARTPELGTSGGIRGLSGYGLSSKDKASIPISHPKKITLQRAIDLFCKGIAPGRMVEGGRKNALVMLRRALATQSDYDNTRDFLKNSTTGLSAAIKFGCISIREMYHAFFAKYGRKNGLIRELIWREFFAHVLHNFPEVLSGSYQPRYRRIGWRTDARATADLKAWKEGRTGFPVVDACMRQLNSTGYMHNRGRMIVANFLIKTLLIDWRMGEQYFAQKLTDYDPASNNGNWQGISGTGVDMKPYFRDMNPWIQSAKFDQDAKYIKRWVPELADVLPRDIHKWYSTHTLEKYANIKYREPMVDYDEQKHKMLIMYEKA